MALALTVRVLTDDLASPESRQSGSLDLSAFIAVLFILLALVLLLRRRKGARTAVLAAVWSCLWTAIAVKTHGASAETIREGVREGSVIALGVILFNANGAFTVRATGRIVQVAGLVPAILALCQLATHTGLDIHGTLRSSGTFLHPDSAAMFSAIAAGVSLWRYLEDGHQHVDAVLTTLFSAALVTTLSIDGLIALATIFLSFGALRAGTLTTKLYHA